MSKEHSEQDTRLTPSKHKDKPYTTPIEEARKAARYYSKIRKDYLQSIKQNYFENLQALKSRNR